MYGPDLSGRATASLTLGIVSICLFWVPFLYLITAVPAGIVAIVFGTKVRNAAVPGQGTGKATAGLVCGIVGLSLCLLSGVVGALMTV